MAKDKVSICFSQELYLWSDTQILSFEIVSDLYETLFW